MICKSGIDLIKPTTRIAILGSYPPNYGGISVHIWRLHQWLAQRAQVDVLDMYNGKQADQQAGVHRLADNAIRSLISARRLLDRLRPDILHVHVSALQKFLMTTPVLLTSRGNPKRVLTIHGGKFKQNLESFNPLQKILFKWMLGRFDHIVCVSAEQHALLAQWGVLETDRSVINAYLPPIKHDNPGLVAEITTRRKAGKLVLLVIAQYLPHYGLLELLQAVAALPPPLRERVAIAHISYLDADAQYQSACSEAASGLDYINHDNLTPPDVAAWLACGDVFVRPTWWDGDAVSVREAAYFGNRVLATDVATRPPGSMLCVVSFDHDTSQDALAALYDRLH